MEEDELTAQAVRLGLGLAMKVKPAGKLIGCGRTRIFELLGDGQLEGVKSGRDTLIKTPSILRYMASLPRAEIKPSKKRVAA